MSREQITVNLPSTPKFVPPWTGIGDREFNGHGPRISLQTKLSIRNHNELWAQVWMRASETQKDWTKAEGSADFLVYRDQRISHIYRIISDSFTQESFEDTGHGEDVRPMPATELVNRFECVGDVKGKDAGIYTGVSVYFNPVTLDVEISDVPPTTIRVDPSPEFVPQYVNGDREFNGHGPKVDITARIEIRNTSEIWATIWMRAKETQADWTEAQGSMNYLLYKHNKPILSIESETFSRHSYTDTNHEPEEFPMTFNDLVSKYECRGDTKGQDAGISTSVVVHYNPISIREAA